MAKLLDCDPDSLSKVETNGVNPSPQMLSKIAKLLEVPLEQLEQAPVHPRILRKKAASTSTAFRTPVAIKRQKILMHRLEIAEKKFHAAAKFLNELYEELCEIKALVTDTQSEEEDRADASSIGSV
jgi:transcriptional regulator with XRE-family HTH domain